MDLDFIKKLNIVNNKDISEKLIEIAEYVKSKEDLAEERLKRLEEYNKEEEIVKLKKKLNILEETQLLLCRIKKKNCIKIFHVDIMRSVIVVLLR